MHEVSRNHRVPQRFAVLLAILPLACGGGRRADGTDAGVNRTPTSAKVLAGIDALLAGDGAALRGRVGLITNHTGRTANGGSTIDALASQPGITLVALFAPEHGIRGTAAPGERVDSSRDTQTGLPIHSLYGETRAPTAAMLRDLDVLAFDIQDIGSRYYTYVWTMALALRAAAENGKRFVVLDRPNPIGGLLVHGNVLDTAFASFVGLYPVPMRHGMTAGELATMINAEYRIGADLTVVRAEGWRRAMWFDETGLTWRAPSPNMPDLESATHYPGTCLFEGTNLSVGRGTPAAFQQIGAPWLNARELASRLNARQLPGVRIDTVTFTPASPADGKYPGVALPGVRFRTTDRTLYDPVRTALAALVEIQSLHRDSLQFRAAHFDRLAGTDRLRNGIIAGQNAQQLTVEWDAPMRAFLDVRAKYLLYP
jgi:uncharacterized protein YbbC (DUF1343 family)